MILPRADSENLRSLQLHRSAVRSASVERARITTAAVPKEPQGWQLSAVGFNLQPIARCSALHKAARHALTGHLIEALLASETVNLIATTKADIAQCPACKEQVQCLARDCRVLVCAAQRRRAAVARLVTTLCWIMRSVDISSVRQTRPSCTRCSRAGLDCRYFDSGRSSSSGSGLTIIGWSEGATL